MVARKFRLSSMVLGVLAISATVAWALGFELGETKEELKLDYEVSAVDHGTGRVTATLTIADEGRLKPLDTVDLFIPGGDGTGYADLSISVALRKSDGKQVATVHLIREWAERAEFRLTTHSLDGKQTPLTWYYHAIPIAKHIKKREPKRK